ncbi:MAG: 3',5'-cyclic-nucleotide phosphodiesterase [Planctomycetaceae bacterium]|nr:3',5'-cyclic-nucleotide phosphodiesterase [Planctomycetales bacterium]MCB9925228.1 3',5'-cyclic-nucleotide phosphodiesterase [Planctomycetaceae bacterium]
MRIKVIGSSVDGSRCQFAASYLFNDYLAIDAGSIGFMSVAAQKRVKHIVLSHSHLDHIASLPIFVDNVYEPRPESVVVYGMPSVIASLQANLFNDLVWPDVVRLSQEESPFIEFVAIENLRPIQLGDLLLTPVALDHVVPTFGFIVDDGVSAAVLVSDTGPTELIWEHASRTARLKCVMLESAFPDSMTWLAEKTKHLTPALMQLEFDKLEHPARHDIKLLVVHIKPAYYEEVTAELNALKLPNLQISEPNGEYEI